MKNCLKLGDKIKVLIDKTIKSPLGTFTCKKDSIQTICCIGDDYVSIEITNSDDFTDTIELSFNEFELI